MQYIEQSNENMEIAMQLKIVLWNFYDVPIIQANIKTKISLITLLYLHNQFPLLPINISILHSDNRQFPYVSNLVFLYKSRIP